jgi:A/G-specific adenine glycosylase
MDVVLGNAELLEVASDGLAWNAVLPQRRDRGTGRTLRQLLAVHPEDQSVVDELRRSRAEGLEEATVQLLVRAVVEAPDYVRDPEVRVVDDAGQVVGGSAVFPEQGDAVEALAERSTGLAVAILALGLSYRPFVPLKPEPVEIADDLLLAAGNVSLRIGVVDPKQHPVAECAIGDGAEGVPDVKGASRAWSETDLLHLRPSLESGPVESVLLAWFAEHGRDLPWRRTRDPYAILVSEVMLQQTQVERVVPRYLDWLDRWPSAEKLAAAPAAEVIRVWQGLGYNRRGLNLHRAAQRIAADGWPDDLTELPGIGPYTAAAVGNFALGRDVLPVDTNVDRVQERTGHRFSPVAAQALMDLGATVCLARIPRCGACPLAAGCLSRGRRYEPLRKQSRYEGSFRQRRAQTLRLVAESERALGDLDREAVESLARDGLVQLAPCGTKVTLP